MNTRLYLRKYLIDIQKELKEILKYAPNEEQSSNIENDLFNDIVNVINDINNYLNIIE